MKIRAIIVENQQSHLAFIRKHLADYQKEIEIIGEYTDARVAKKAIEQLQPDVLFLDIRMSPISGLELAKQVKEICPYFIFLSCYPEYASDAFQAEAIFLIDKIRIEEFLPEAVKRLKVLLENGKSVTAKLQQIIILPSQKLTLILNNNDVLSEVTVQLLKKEYNTLSKFIAYKLLGNLCEKEELSIINQKRDIKSFTNFWQSRHHFMTGLNQLLAPQRIQFSESDFFAHVPGNGYSFALTKDNISFKFSNPELDNWVIEFMNPVIKNKNLKITCVIQEGQICISSSG